MEIRGPLDLNLNELKNFKVDPHTGSFPTATLGQMIYREDLSNLFVCIQVVPAPLWLPLASPNAFHAHNQVISDNIWRFNHGLGSDDVFVQVYDTNGYQVIPQEIVVEDEDWIRVEFSGPESGKCIVAVLSETQPEVVTKITDFDLTENKVWVGDGTNTPTETSFSDFPGGITLKKFQETKDTNITGTTPDIDLDNGTIFYATVASAETTFTFSNPSASGTVSSFSLYVVDGESQTVNWPASVKWPGGTKPTLTASGIDMLVFTTFDGGTTWYGNLAGLDYQ